MDDVSDLLIGSSEQNSMSVILSCEEKKALTKQIY